MSTTPSPSTHVTGYTTLSYPHIAAVSSSSSLPMTTSKPKIPKVNVFSNDGSFLERFHKLKRVSCLTFLSRMSTNHSLGVCRTSSRRRNRRNSYNSMFTRSRTFHESSYSLRPGAPSYAGNATSTIDLRTEASVLLQSPRFLPPPLVSRLLMTTVHDRRRGHAPSLRRGPHDATATLLPR